MAVPPWWHNELLGNETQCFQQRQIEEHASLLVDQKFLHAKNKMDRSLIYETADDVSLKVVFPTLF